MVPYTEMFRHDGESPKGFQGAFFRVRIEPDSPLHGNVPELLQAAAADIAGLYNNRNMTEMGLRIVASADGQHGMVLWLSPNGKGLAHPVFTTNGVEILVSDPAFIPGVVLDTGIGICESRERLAYYRGEARWVGELDGLAGMVADSPQMAETIGHAINRYPERTIVAKRRKYF